MPKQIANSSLIWLNTKLQFSEYFCQYEQDGMWTAAIFYLKKSKAGFINTKNPLWPLQF